MRRAAKDAKSGRVQATSNESARRNAAFAEYKKSVAREDAARLAEEQRAVREKKLELKERCEAVNSAKADIDALAKKVEAMKASDAEAEAEKGGAPAEAASVVSAETYEAMARLKESKASYRRAFDDVKALREAIEPLALRANGTRAKLVASFQEWYEKGGGADLMVERDAEEEDMDYGEKFDQLELRRVLARDPEGGAFFAAKKELALNRHKHAPIVRSVQHMRAVGAGTPRRPF
jgi:kinesin family protein 6/9